MWHYRLLPGLPQQVPLTVSDSGYGDLHRAFSEVRRVRLLATPAYNRTTQFADQEKAGGYQEHRGRLWCHTLRIEDRNFTRLWRWGNPVVAKG
jgi:hypothetical protein